MACFRMLGRSWRTEAVGESETVVVKIENSFNLQTRSGSSLTKVLETFFSLNEDLGKDCVWRIQASAAHDAAVEDLPHEVPGHPGAADGEPL
jgi:hypothetical protein